MLYDGDTFDHAGHTFQVRFQNDGDADAPWDREDGHGPVSGWRAATSKRPGELVLCADGSRARFYDFAEACRIARRDGWGPADPEFVGTAAQRAAKAAREDFDRLRRWCADLWSYVGVVVTLLDDEGEPTEHQDSLWGVESDAGDYLAQVARNMADIILSDLVPAGLDALRAIVDNASPMGLADPVV